MSTIISDIANGIEKGENKRNNCILLEDAMLPGMAVYETPSPDIHRVRMVGAATKIGLLAGILGQRYDQNLDGTSTNKVTASGDESWYVSEGYCPAFIEAPSQHFPIGTLLYCGTGSTVADGYLSTTVNAEAIAELVEPMGPSDEVGIIKLLRG